MQNNICRRAEKEELAAIKQIRRGRAAAVKKESSATIDNTQEDKRDKTPKQKHNQRKTLRTKIE